MDAPPCFVYAARCSRCVPSGLRFFRGRGDAIIFECDVEGAEDEVFRGAANILREWHPTIVCEMHSMDNQFALIRYFRELGYSCRLLDQNHVLALFA